MQWREQTGEFPMETKSKYVGNRFCEHGNLLRAHIHCIVGIVLWELHS